ncbi:hypothetical protein WICMUC_001406 [Wickerhamomyces mucosus]|uniref:Nuclear distribution protein PAC1 n=1 Tax=Wickerhamomyces mucosus TaxID=1378264 RepID=A0A9P8PW71_9ASCO|nr:hypothetical protein WICMUC_001406 [Wickerhamomyces mucosus]
MSLLSIKQTEDLNNSILNYLKPLISPSVLSNLQSELQISSIKDDNELLVKKWNAILRLQKKVVDLEQKLELSTKQITAKLLNEDSSLTKFYWIPSRLKKTLNNNSVVTSTDIHPKLPFIVNAGSDGTFTIWNYLDLTQPQSTTQAHPKQINDLAISPKPLEFNENSHVLVTASSDLFVKVWDLKTLKLIRTLTGHEHVVSSIVFRNEAQIFTASRDMTIKLWDLKLGWCLKTFKGHSDWVRTIDINETFEFLLSGSNDQSVRLSHGESGTGLGLLLGHNQVVETVKFVPSISNAYLDILNPSTVNNEIYTKLGYKYAVTGGRDDVIRFWLLPVPILRPHNHPLPSSNPQGICIQELIGHKSWIKDLAFHPNGKVLFSCSDDKSIRLWNIETMTCISTLEAHTGFINSISIAPPVWEIGEDKQTKDEQKINENMRTIFISGSTDQTVKVWE